jgi:hypothetical protein
MRFFFYGSLLDGAIRRAVMGEGLARCRIVPAVLDGWRRCRRRDLIYPVLKRERGRTVEGCLADGVDAVTAARLSAFEGENYTTRTVSVRCADGARADAFVFMPKRSLASPSAWNFDEWSRGRQRWALRRANSGMAYDGRIASGAPLRFWRGEARRQTAHAPS